MKSKFILNSWGGSLGSMKEAVVKNTENRVVWENIWQIRSRFVKHAHKIRAEVTAHVSQAGPGDLVLDVGCREGYITSFLVDKCDFVVGLDISREFLKIAKSKLRGSKIDFCQGDATKLPFKSLCFDKIMVLELLEHLTDPRACVKEVDRCAGNDAILTLSLPWKEKIPYVKHKHSGRLVPRWGHLHSFSEKDVVSFLPSYYELVTKKNLPNFYLHVITSLPILNHLPLKTWLAINNALGKINKGYWAIYKFKKLGSKSRAAK